jgi:hypothetical protein
MFQLSKDEVAALRSQIATSDAAALENRLEQIEREMNERLGDHDERLSEIFRVLHQLIAPPLRPKRPIGFRVDD